jgi:hypothetical protein
MPGGSTSSSAKPAAAKRPSSPRRQASPKGARPPSGRPPSAPKSRPSSAAASGVKKGGAQGALGAYTKLKAVGKGSFGQIWLVRHTQKGGESVVLKEVNLKKLSTNEVAAAKREIDVVKKASHEHIVGFVNTFELEGVVGLVMEYAPAGDLGSAITKRVSAGRTRFPESQITTLCVQLASALDYLHESLQLLHRDVKPANIFMTEAGDVKLGVRHLRPPPARTRPHALVRADCCRCCCLRSSVAGSLHCGLLASWACLLVSSQRVPCAVRRAPCATRVALAGLWVVCLDE